MTLSNHNAIFRDDYGFYRWWPYREGLHGAYYLVVTNVELYRLQGNTRPHVICVVDDFGNLVRRGWQ